MMKLFVMIMNMVQNIVDLDDVAFLPLVLGFVVPLGDVFLGPT